MKYRGALYANVSGRFMMLQETSEDYDNLEQQVKDLSEELKNAQIKIKIYENTLFANNIEANIIEEN